MPVFKLPKMTKQEIWELMRGQNLCRIAFKGDVYPYIAPFQYVILNDTLYFHFTNYGNKMKLIKKDKKVCVEIEEYKKDLSEYKFIVLRGNLEFVINSEERAKALNKIVDDGKQKISTNFLPAHGFRKQDGWSSISQNKNSLVIIKLVNIIQKIGLKSP